MIITLKGSIADQNEEFKESIRKKVSALSRYVSDIKEVVITVQADHHHKKETYASAGISAYLLCHGNAPLHVHESASDVHEAFDSALAHMKSLLVSHKEKDHGIDQGIILKAKEK